MSYLGDLFRLGGDLLVAGGEYCVTRIKFKALLEKSKKGSGQKVMLLPGFGATDGTLLPLKEFLQATGFEVQTWGLGLNKGFDGEAGPTHMTRMTERVQEQILEFLNGSTEKVALVGHSFGGLYARETAARYPHLVERVITMGSPTVHPYFQGNQNKLVVALASRSRKNSGLKKRNTRESLTRRDLTGPSGFLHLRPASPPIPCVAIWSPIDAVVFEESARIPDFILQAAKAPAVRENIRIVCSHTGMLFNEAVLLAVADRLVEPVQYWNPFNFSRYFESRVLRYFHPVEDSAIKKDLHNEFKDHQLVRGWQYSGKHPEKSQNLQFPKVLLSLLKDHRDFRDLESMLQDLLNQKEKEREKLKLKESDPGVRCKADAENSAEDPDLLLLADIVRYLLQYLDLFHHPLEETLAEMLPGSSHSGLENDNPARLQTEHQKINELGNALSQKIEKFSSNLSAEFEGQVGEEVGKAAGKEVRSEKQAEIYRLWSALSEQLKSHFTVEETKLFPRLLQHLTPEQWQQLESHWDQQGYGKPWESGPGAYDFGALLRYLEYWQSQSGASVIKSKIQFSFSGTGELGTGAGNFNDNDFGFGNRANQGYSFSI